MMLPFSAFQDIYSGWCTEVTACIRTKSGRIVIRLATWRPHLRASSWVHSATFAVTEFYEVGIPVAPSAPRRRFLA
jgi:hypothetical protein